MSTASKFQALSEEVCAKAAKIDCSIADYVEGLEILIADLESAKEAAEYDLDAEERRTDDDDT